MVTMMTLAIQCGLIKIEARICVRQFSFADRKEAGWGARTLRSYVTIAIELQRDAEAQDVPDARSD